MTTKVAIIATVGILIGAMAVGFAVLYFRIDLGSGGATERAEMLGQGLGMLCLIPLGVIWIMWAARFRKERERKQRSRSSRR